MEKYININDIFESCFNHIIANNIKKAYYSFIDNYYKHPNKIELLTKDSRVKKKKTNSKTRKKRR